MNDDSGTGQSEIEVLAERAFLDVTATVEPGVTERAFAAALDAAVKRHGARGLSFEPIVAGLQLSGGQGHTKFTGSPPNSAMYSQLRRR